MSENLRRSVALCNQLIDLLEDDCRALDKNLQGEIYDEYKALMQEQIEDVKTIKRGGQTNG